MKNLIVTCRYFCSVIIDNYFWRKRCEKRQYHTGLEGLKNWQEICLYHELPTFNNRLLDYYLNNLAKNEEIIVTFEFETFHNRLYLFTSLLPEINIYKSLCYEHDQIPSDVPSRYNSDWYHRCNQLFFILRKKENLTVSYGFNRVFHHITWSDDLQEYSSHSEISDSKEVLKLIRMALQLEPIFDCFDSISQLTEKKIVELASDHCHFFETKEVTILSDRNDDKFKETFDKLYQQYLLFCGATPETCNFFSTFVLRMRYKPPFQVWTSTLNI